MAGVRLQANTLDRSIGFKIALVGVGLMIVGVSIASQLGDVAAGLERTTQAQKIVFLVSCVGGAILTLWGAIRISMVLPPSLLAMVGFALNVLRNRIPRSAAEVFRAMKTHQRALPMLIPLFTVGSSV